MNFKMTDDFRKFLAGVPDYRKGPPAPKAKEFYMGSDSVVLHLPASEINAIKNSAALYGMTARAWLRAVILEACTK